jgi:hypothetical protein
MKHLIRVLTIPASAVLFAACGSGGANPAPVVDQSPPQAELPQTLCDLLPLAEAEKIMGKALVAQRNDDSGCHYEDARGTTGTGLWVFLNAFEVSDQCRLTSGSEPFNDLGGEACISGQQDYTTVVFRAGGRTFDVIAPGRDRATAVARAILSKLGA